jgi:tetratricopeptide (TPR) repeat protein
MKLSLLLLIALLHGAAAHAANCLEVEDRIDAEVARLRAAEDSLTLLRRIGTDSLAAVTDCPSSDRLWYLAARAAELLELPSGGQAFIAYGGFKTIVGDAEAHRPASFAIATIGARLDGSSAAARRALTLNPDYPPARRALAFALSREGNIEESLGVATIQRPHAADHLVRAKILLAGDRPLESEKEAEAAIKAPGSDPDEVTLPIELQRDANETLGFALLKQGQTERAKRAFRIAAADGSIPARTQMQSMR